MTMTIADVVRAQTFAIEAHDGQLRKDERTPYIQHPREVARIVSGHVLENYDALVLAWLHDTVEDTAATLMDIERAFGSGMGTLVFYISTPEYYGKAMNRACRKLYDHMRLKTAPFTVKLVKIADRIANLRDVDHLDRGFRELYAMESWGLRNAIVAGMDDVERGALGQLVIDLDTEISKRIPPMVMEDDAHG